MNKKSKKLVLFLTYGMSLKEWKRIGILDREVKPYNYLAENYFEKIYFVSYGNKKDFEIKKKYLDPNIEVITKPKFLPDFFYSFLVLFLRRKILRSVDFLKTNQMNGAWTAVLAKWLFKKKLIIRCGYEWFSFETKQKKGFLKKQFVYLIERIAYKNADVIFLASESDKKFVLQQFKIPLSKIFIIPNYIDTNVFKPLNIPKEKNRVIFVGRFERQKNLFNLLEAVKNLPIKLILIGNGSLKEKLKNYADINNLDVKFLGDVSNEKLPTILNIAEVFILPSIYEGCPKALLEAMSCGLACIGSDVEGIREIIEHKKNGYLCNADAGSIKKAIQEVLRDKKLRKKIAENARKTILEKFSLNKILEKEIKIYEELLR